MIVYVWLKAVILGILVTAPVGPVGALVIRRTLRSGFLLGFTTGLGAALADASFALLAGIGLSAVESFIARHELVLASLGAGVLLTLGSVSFVRHWKEMKASSDAPDAASVAALGNLPEVENSGVGPRDHFRAALSSFFITVSNPVTVLGFAATFAAFGFQLEGRGLYCLLWIVSGVLTGALLWWSGLAGFMSWVGGRLSKKRVAQVQLSTAVIILGSGIYCLIRAVLL